MPLILVDALPRGQVLINTDQITFARHMHGNMTICFVDGREVAVPHESAASILDEINERGPIE